MLRWFDCWVLVEGSPKNEVCGRVSRPSEERALPIRGVRGFPLVCGLEDLSKAAVFIASRAWTALKCSVRSGPALGGLLCVGDLKGFCQGHQTLDRFVVGFADLLGLVGVHRLEDLAKGSVGRCVLVVCVGHVCVSFWKKV